MKKSIIQAAVMLLAVSSISLVYAGKPTRSPQICPKVSLDELKTMFKNAKEANGGQISEDYVSFGDKDVQALVSDPNFSGKKFQIVSVIPSPKTPGEIEEPSNKNVILNAYGFDPLGDGTYKVKCNYARTGEGDLPIYPAIQIKYLYTE